MRSDFDDAVVNGDMVRIGTEVCRYVGRSAFVPSDDGRKTLKRLYKSESGRMYWCFEVGIVREADGE
jgi:hypothetical protein